MSDAEDESRITNPEDLPTEIPLRYSPDGARPRRRLIQRILVSLLIAGVALATLNFAPRVYTFATSRYWQRQCMNFEAPPTVAVYERFAVAASRLPVQPPYTDAKLANERATRTASVGLGDIECQIPTCLRRFLEASGQNLSPLPEPIAFCHSRVSPNGTVRLVVVECSRLLEGHPWMVPFKSGEFLQESFESWAFEPATFSGHVATHLGSMSRLHHGPISEMLPAPRRIFAGQADSSDMSHFTIGYEWPDGSRGVLDGYLRNDGTVDIVIRPGPGDVNSASQAFAANPSGWRLK